MSKKDYDKIAIGQRIKQIRLDKGMTLEEFGKLFGASKGNVGMWEKGSSLPNPERLKAIAKIGDMTVEELLYGNQDEQALYLFNSIWDEVMQNHSDSPVIQSLSSTELKHRKLMLQDKFLPIPKIYSEYISSLSDEQKEQVNNTDVLLAIAELHLKGAEHFGYNALKKALAKLELLLTIEPSSNLNNAIDRVINIIKEEYSQFLIDE